MTWLRMSDHDDDMHPASSYHPWLLVSPSLSWRPGSMLIPLCCPARPIAYSNLNRRYIICSELHYLISWLLGVLFLFTKSDFFSPYFFWSHLITFNHILLTFWSHFAHILITFWSHFIVTHGEWCTPVTFWEIRNTFYKLLPHIYCCGTHTVIYM